MKLRIRGNSLRLRISRSELESLLRGNRIEETIHFTASPEAKLTYALDSAVQSTPITIQYESQAVTVTLSKDQAVVWGSESEVGVYGELDNGGTHLLEVSSRRTSPALTEVTRTTSIPSPIRMSEPPPHDSSETFATQQTASRRKRLAVGTCVS
jgi:Family of unknown function (DUF7009)